jgi:hypothetical protein
LTFLLRCDWIAGSQRHSAGNIDYDNVEVSREEDGKVVAVVHPEGSKPFRARSKTISDGMREYSPTLDH